MKKSILITFGFYLFIVAITGGAPSVSFASEGRDYISCEDETNLMIMQR